MLLVKSLISLTDRSITKDQEKYKYRDIKRIAIAILIGKYKFDKLVILFLMVFVINPQAHFMSYIDLNLYLLITVIRDLLKCNIPLITKY
jgi:hypothetical protein